MPLLKQKQNKTTTTTSTFASPGGNVECLSLNRKVTNENIGNKIQKLNKSILEYMI